MGMYSLNKSRDILQTAYDWYNRRLASLDEALKRDLETRMLALEEAINQGHRAEAARLAERLESLSKERCKKSFFEYGKELAVALLVALFLAVVVRQMWFEPYEIPTGSMRPTFREQDRITVTKTAFGLNIPLTTGHFLFEPANVQRTSAITFTSEGIKNLDEDTPFLGIFPYKKRLIKRTIGKPGDSLYFYGGKIYGVDKDGQALDEFLTAPWMENLEHIPFLSFGGKKSYREKKTFFSQMNLPLGRISVSRGQQIGEIFNGQTWVKDDPAVQKKEHTSLQAYSDFFGMRNFAMARLLTRKDLQHISPRDAESLPEAPLYLELSHHPSLSYPKPSIAAIEGRSSIFLNPLKSVIPLQAEHLDAIMNSMYTARLVFKDGRATRYSTEAPVFDASSPQFAGVPDGTYEFYDGKLVEVGFGATTYAADKGHPLYSRDPANVQKLFNLGIEMQLYYQPDSKYALHFPSRYAYFRAGDLYLLGHPVLKKEDPTLVAFNKAEAEMEQKSSADRPYTAFRDYGPPLKEGKYDTAFIRTFGVTLPEGEYLLLGDNHAMSADSRVFGFIPEANLQGAPSLILWPPGARWGVPEQKPYPLITLPRMLVWGVVSCGLAIWYALQYRRRHRPIRLTKALMEKGALAAKL